MTARQSFAKTCFILVLAILFGTSVAQAQNAADKKKAQVLKMLQEKKIRNYSHVNSTERRTTYDEQVSTNGAGIDEGEVSVIYNPNDSAQLILSFMESDSITFTFPIYYSSDAGATWTLSTFSSLDILAADFPGGMAGGYGDPSFAWDKNGRVYFSWIYLTVTPPSTSYFFNLNWAYSDNAGHTWNVKPNHIIGHGALDSLGSVAVYGDGLTDREWLTIDNSGGPHQGNVYCSFTCFPPDSIPTFEAIKVLKPSIDTFGPIVSVYTGGTQFGNVEVNNTGILHISFADLDRNRIMHASSANGGVSFTPANVISDAVSLKSGSYIVHNRENSAPSLSVDGISGTGNNVHAVWSDFPGTTVVSYYAHSTDGGVTWSVPHNLNNDFPGKFTFMPTVAANGSNVAISVTAIDSVDSAKYYQLNSTDNGSTFSPTLLSASATNYTAMGAAS